MPRLEHLITPLVAAYRDLYQRQKMVARLKHGKKDEFFGLRDFYRCVVNLESHISSILLNFVKNQYCPFVVRLMSEYSSKLFCYTSPVLF